MNSARLFCLALTRRGLQISYSNVSHLRSFRMNINFCLIRHRSDFRNNNVTHDFLEKLCHAIGKEKLSTASAVRDQYGTDEGCYGCSPADIVTYPHSVDDICKIAKLCITHSVPLIPHGAGTGIEHGIGAVMGGVTVDLALLNSVIELNVDDFDCTVEAGITRKTLNMYLRQTGLMFPILVLMHLLGVWHLHLHLELMLCTMVL